MNLLQGEIGAYRDIVCANTAALMKLTGHISDLKQGVQEAARVIDNGDALSLLNNYKNILMHKS